ncbi:hypothetical protein R3P38DRAFT_3027241, partial [Favolaschia claudopus]
MLYDVWGFLRVGGWLPSTQMSLEPKATALERISCVQNATSSFQDLIACFDTYTVSEPGYYSEESYTAAQPSTEELYGWEELIASLLSVDRNCTSVILPQSIAPIYEVSLFNGTTGSQYCVASEKFSVDGFYNKGWGLFVVPATQAAVSRDIHLAAPHPAYDLFTPEQAGALFELAGARSLLIAGRVRNANLVPSDCVVPKTNSTVYYKTDPAHDTAEPFFSASKTIWDWQHAKDGCPSQSCAFIQMHGKGADTCPTDAMFLSSGIGRSAFYTDAVDRPIKRLKAELLKAFPDWNISLPSDSGCSLTATENVFGRLVNGIDEGMVCTEAPTAGLMSGEFIHIEQAKMSRLASVYPQWTAALLAAFSPPAQSDAPVKQ